MMRIVVAPDKFKGSLPAAAVAAAIAAGLRAVCPAAELVTIPVADGGEGTVDAAVAAGFERVPVTAAGPTGDPVQASYARRGEVAVLADGLRRWAAVVAGATGTDWSLAPGSGAAGGVGFAARAVLGARSRPGIGLVLELAGFDAALADADLVITGEGSLDRQSLAGKAPVGVARAAARLGIPVVAVAGHSTLTAAELATAGIAAIYPLSDLEPDLERCRAEAGPLLRRAGQMIAHDRLAAAVTGG
jgi:glycerate kinase